MSDSESYYQNSTTNQPIPRSDEVLDDHRNQITNDCAISDSEDELELKPELESEVVKSENNNNNHNIIIKRLHQIMLNH